MSWQATEWVRTTRVGDSKLKLLLLMLCNYANEKGESWYPQDQISFDTEIPVRTLRRKLEELQALGFIEVVIRTGESGLRESSLIRVLMGPSANMAAGGVHRPKEGVTTGQKEGDPSANKMAAVNLNHSNHSNHNTRAKKGEVAYSEDFEAIWKQYPRTKNSPKKDAWNRYRMLNAERQEMVRRAVPLFAAAMRAENRPEDKIKHMVAWIHSGMYETASAPAGASANGAPANDVPFWKRATREQWGKVLDRWRETERWSASWGPDPDQSTCKVPADMLAAHNLKYRRSLFRQADLERFEVLASKQPVDTTHGPML